MEALVTASIAAITGMAFLTNRLHNRIDRLTARVDKVELRVATDYVTKQDLSQIMERMEAHLIRIEEKMDNIANRCWILMIQASRFVKIRAIFFMSM